MDIYPNGIFSLLKDHETFRSPDVQLSLTAVSSWLNKAIKKNHRDFRLPKKSVKTNKSKQDPRETGDSSADLSQFLNKVTISLTAHGKVLTCTTLSRKVIISHERMKCFYSCKVFLKSHTSYQPNDPSVGSEWTSRGWEKIIS